MHEGLAALNFGILAGKADNLSANRLLQVAAGW